MLDYLIVGSGPAGISLAKSLLGLSKRVTLIDPGQHLEDARKEKIVNLASVNQTEWNAEQTAFLREGMSSSASGILLKLAYGSDFPYRASNGATPMEQFAADTKPSYAQGGLSTVWGSAVMPYRQQDLDGWPIQVADLEEGYREVLKWVPLAARHDDLEKEFPLYSDRLSEMPISRQSQNLLQRLKRHKDKLNRQGVFYGGSRLAVAANPDIDSPGCVKCGLCMYGCPHQIIYSSGFTLRELARNPLFDYKPGLTVQSVTETSEMALLKAKDAAGRAVELTARRIFLAAGVLETASIVLRSEGRYDWPLTLRDSQYFLLPLLRSRNTPDVITENLHTLSQIFFEVFDPEVSPYTVHLQTYTYNELFRDAVRSKLGPLNPAFPMSQFMGRLLLFQGYLHSVHSSHLQLTLKKNGVGDYLDIVGVSNNETSIRLRKLIRKLAKLAPMTDLLPMFPLLEVGKAGRGFHCGGTFPMSRNPQGSGTDIYGRPFGWKRIHLVDASVFPTVPATTITLTVMANAYRIGRALTNYD